MGVSKKSIFSYKLSFWQIMTKTRNTKGETARRQRRWLCALGEKKYTSYVKLGDRSSSTGMRGSLSKKKFLRALVVCAASLFLSTKNAFARLIKTGSEVGGWAGRGATETHRVYKSSDMNNKKGCGFFEANFWHWQGEGTDICGFFAMGKSPS